MTKQELLALKKKRERLAARLDREKQEQKRNHKWWQEKPNQNISNFLKSEIKNLDEQISQNETPVYKRRGKRSQ